MYVFVFQLSWAGGLPVSPKPPSTLSTWLGAPESWTEIIQLGPFSSHIQLCYVHRAPLKSLEGERRLKLRICSPSFFPWSCVGWWHSLLWIEGHNLVKHPSSHSSVSLWALVMALSYWRVGRSGTSIPLVTNPRVLLSQRFSLGIPSKIRVLVDSFNFYIFELEGTFLI